MRAGAICAALLVLVATSSHAQVFKCTENGKTVFSDRPCGDTAREVDVRPARGGYDPGAAARIRNQTERLNSQFAAQDRAREAARQADAARIDAERKAKADKCSQIRRERDRAEYWAGEFRHKDNIARERAAQKDAQDALWWECREVW